MPYLVQVSFLGYKNSFSLLISTQYINFQIDWLDKLWPYRVIFCWPQNSGEMRYHYRTVFTSVVDTRGKTTLRFNLFPTKHLTAPTLWTLEKTISNLTIDFRILTMQWSVLYMSFPRFLFNLEFLLFTSIDGTSFKRPYLENLSTLTRVIYELKIIFVPRLHEINVPRTTGF